MLAPCPSTARRALQYDSLRVLKCRLHTKVYGQAGSPSSLLPHWPILIRSLRPAQLALPISFPQHLDSFPFDHPCPRLNLDLRLKTRVLLLVCAPIRTSGRLSWRKSLGETSVWVCRLGLHHGKHTHVLSHDLISTLGYLHRLPLPSRPRRAVGGVSVSLLHAVLHRLDPLPERRRFSGSGFGLKHATMLPDTGRRRFGLPLSGHRCIFLSLAFCPPTFSVRAHLRTPPYWLITENPLGPDTI